MKHIIFFFLACLVFSACHSSQNNPVAGLRAEVTEEVRNNVLPFWSNYALSPDGSFYGTVMRDGTPVADAPRGGVLNSRILWSFAAAARTFGNETYFRLADQAQRYFLDTFIDRTHGGVYWLVAPDGTVVNSSKYTYAMTYGIYGLAEHYLATGNHESLDAAIDLYHTLEKKGRDPQYDGYIEAFTQDWQRLDNYDNNAPKTMNAHLHVLEAYTLLYRCWQDEELRERLEFCTRLFMDRIYDPARKHFNLFFDDAWNSLVDMDSYGHDVETGWLLCEAARTLGNAELVERAERMALEVTDTCLAQGMAPEGCMLYERKGGKTARHCSWWGQAETMLACLNAWQISGDDRYLQHARTVWEFVKTNLIDHEYGEWFSDWLDGQPQVNAPKVSMWRCPYHTVRLGCRFANIH